jgi:hypothetical protein
MRFPPLIDRIPGAGGGLKSAVMQGCS